jgi:hypothetical protein
MAAKLFFGKAQGKISDPLKVGIEENAFGFSHGAGTT